MGGERERRERRCFSPGEEGKQKSSAAVLSRCVWFKQKILDIRAEKKKNQSPAEATSTGEDIFLPPEWAGSVQVVCRSCEDRRAESHGKVG